MNVFQDPFGGSHQALLSIDYGNFENQLAVVEYVEDIYKFYRTIEACFSVNDCSFLLGWR